MTQVYAASALSTPTRYRDRASYDADAVHAVLDEALHCHIAFVRDGRPVSLPTMHARDGETIYVHGSTGGRFALLDGEPICVTVTLIDALVLARSWMHHSVGYRSVVAHGEARIVRDPAERLSAMRALIEKMHPGRSDESRPPSAKEDAATAVVALKLETVSLKSRGDHVADDEIDLDGPFWAGTIPLSVQRGPVRPAPDLADGIRIPEALDCNGIG
ncbi:MAG TPA: pyridoxamine 5'-phosphate oxidase family protein [Actinospica sp.]|jgi:nitroimidazol reductase NimA-like FMN-containing flavoprotein (pyridoxamine 5'-phosphate oxidase superfamily)|nr:pyridoxamine 5'-phosphate oxidase family protein [Actinospica sp.]